VDNGSPFKPKRVLRRSFGGPRKDQIEEGSERPMDTEIAEEDEEDVEESEAEAGADAEADSDEPQPLYNDQPDEPSSDDDAPPMFDNNEDFYDAQRESDDAEINEALQHAESILQTTPTTAPAAAKARGRPRKSDQTTISQPTPQTAQTSSSSRKRDRTEMEEEENVADDDDDVANQTLQSIEQSQNEVPHVSATSDDPPKRKRGRPRKSDNNETSQNETSQVSVTTDNAAKRKPGRPRKNDIPVLQDPVNVEESLQGVEQDENDASQVSAVAESPARKRPGRPRKSDVTVVTDNGEQTIDPGNMAYGDSYLAPINEDDEVEVEAAPASPITKKKPGRPKAQKATKTQKAPAERDPNQSMRQTPTGSPGKANGRDLALSRSPSKRAASVSNVNLRASTPFEDAHQRMSRSGRPILAPLKHWAGESYVWKNGEVEGIIRADEVKTPRGDKKKKVKGRRRVPRAGAPHGLDMVPEESDTESTVPDEWEEQVGVIAGTVAAWDPDLQQGIPGEPIREGMFIKGFACMIGANFYRYRVRLIIDRDQRCCWVVLPIRQDHDSPLLRIRHCRVAARGLQTREELAQDADGVLCAPRQGSGDGWPACSRAEWPRRIGQRGRDERVRHLQRWCVGRSKRYVSALLFACFPSFFLPPPYTPHCIAFFSHTIGESARALEKKPHHATIVDAGFHSTHRPRSRKQEAVNKTCQLIYQTRKNSRMPDPKRCVQPAVGITSASHRNTARAAYRCTTPCQGPSVLLLQAPYLHPFQRIEELPTDGVLHCRCQHAFCLRSHGIGATTAFWGWLVWLLCDFDARNGNPCGTVLVWRFACFCFVSRPLLVHSSFFLG
jgi:hypothetical protein